MVRGTFENKRSGSNLLRLGIVRGSFWAKYEENAASSCGSSSRRNLCLPDRNGSFQIRGTPYPKYYNPDYRDLQDGIPNARSPVYHHTIPIYHAFKVLLIWEPLKFKTLLQNTCKEAGTEEQDRLSVLCSEETRRNDSV